MTPSSSRESPASMPRGNQLTRQWQLLQLLDRPAGVAVDDAARDLGCTVRTIWRDLRVLQDAGFPIYDERRPTGAAPSGAGGRLQAPAAAQALARRAGRAPDEPRAARPRRRRRPRPRRATSAFEQIGSVLSKDALALIDQMRDTIGVRACGAKLQAPAAEHLAAIQARARRSAGACASATTP